MTSRIHSYVLAVASCVLSSNCTDRIRPELSIASHCNPCEVQPSGGPFVSATIRNVSSNTVLLASCGTSIIPIREQFIGGTWVLKPLAICAVSAQAVELPPGEVAFTAFYNFGGNAGVYRFRAPLYRDGGQHPSGEASPEFTIQ